MDFWTIINILIFASFLWPVLQNKLAIARRLALIKQFEEQKEKDFYLGEEVG